MTGHGVIRSADAPAAIGPYSQAVLWNGLVYTSGQIALDPRTGELLADDIALQTERVLANLAAVLERAGSSLGCVLKTTVYLRDMADFAAMNVVYARHFADRPPARSTVAAAGLPKGARVEIDAVARLRGAGGAP
jgi:2-iminobutanoate/2-iminopropanoate deaminase